VNFVFPLIDEKVKNHENAPAEREQVDDGNV